MNKYQKAILETIDYKLQKFQDGLKYNRTIEGAITEVVNENTYRVRIYGNTEELKAVDDRQYEVGDIVKVIVYNGNYSDKAIWHKRV